ncbi:MAG: alpha/beta hydrolase [Rhodobacteraceae bacterium]|nr:alpha/beta hydrolase [Paracoccaceae bacterium]MAY45118.1 alpha/beta hydrolase [Paracoccaceae bacterium]QEW23052.1 4,5:9,10-diseco-3-hydroxy-5,9, 17-trioxoandrosta-1(10),2-diene-4-oate hydrolase [Marinibacterium anthonyi]
MIGWLLLAAILALIAWPLLREATRQPMDAGARRGAEGDFAELSQGVTHYQWTGPLRGPVVVCIHGLTTPSFVWRAVARGLAGWGYRVLTYDLYGRGYSDRPKGRQDRTFFLTQLQDLLDHEGITEDITLCGYSMGGAIATAYAAQRPDRIRRLILLAPAGTGLHIGPMVRFIRDTPVIGDWLMLAVFPDQHIRATEAERDLPSSVHDIVDRQQEELSFRGFIPAVLSSLRGILSEDFESDHRALRDKGVPVIAIWGRDDTVVPLSAMGRLTEWSRDARQEVVDGAGHGLAYTHTAGVLAALRATLADA